MSRPHQLRRAKRRTSRNNRAMLPVGPSAATSPLHHLARLATRALHLFRSPRIRGLAQGGGYTLAMVPRAVSTVVLRQTVRLHIVLTPLTLTRNATRRALWLARGHTAPYIREAHISKSFVPRATLNALHRRAGYYSTRKPHHAPCKSTTEVNY